MGAARVSPHSVEPVLFVHGYTPAPAVNLLVTADRSALGGGDDTWGAFPRLLEERQLSNLATHLPVRAYEFQWATNARFEQAADDLAQAIDEIFRATGEPVTIVAHSFGGVLVRTMLRRGTNDFESALQIAGKIRQVVTLGAPHSGIATSNNYMVNGVSLPEGGEGSFIRWCHQVPCHQMGLVGSPLGVPTLSADDIQVVGVSPVVW